VNPDPAFHFGVDPDLASIMRIREDPDPLPLSQST
jgi:hypothetical protein